MTTCHEARHCYQYLLSGCYTNLIPEERNLYAFQIEGVPSWIDNMNYYNICDDECTNDEYFDYLNQPLEVDVNGWARSEVFDYFYYMEARRMNQVEQNKQSVEELYKKDRCKALILWGVLLVITVTAIMLVPKVETAYLIAQGGTDIIRIPWHKWIVGGIIAVITFLVPYHRIYNWLKKVFRNHIRSEAEAISLKEALTISAGMVLYGGLMYLLQYFDINEWDIPLFVGILTVVFGSMVITACLDNVGWQLFYNFIIIAAVFGLISLSIGIESTQSFVAFASIIGISYAVIQLYYRVGSEISIGRRIGEAILFALEPVLLTGLGVHYILGGSWETAHIWNVCLIAIQAPTIWGWLLLVTEMMLVVVLIWLTVWIGRLGFEQKLAAMLLTIMILFVYLMQLLSVMGIFEMRIYVPIGYVLQSSVIFLMLYLKLITGKIFWR